MMRRLAAMAAIAVVTFVGALDRAAPASAASGTWEQIARTGVLRVGIIPERPPYIYKQANAWKGFSIVMAEDLAQALSVAMEKEIKPEWVMTSWPTVILDLQANKLDVFFGFAFSEERKKAIDLFGPLYALPEVAVNAKGTSFGSNWSDYNKPGVTVAAAMGTTDEQAARQYLPKATIRAMKSMGEVVLDIQSGNSQAIITSAIVGLGAMSQNPNLASVNVLQPLSTTPSGGGVRKDGDGKLHSFIQGFSWTYRASGRSKQVIFEAMKELNMDISKLPADVRF
ncbi:MAG: transporter substrate-binding domain-containing protein [Proteobacteria bacterium]|nr:transporter substrate-binding domain-containing protein [Pseudomonadota bacterium]